MASEEKAIETALGHARSMFVYHAGQRHTALRFYFTVFAAIVAAIATLLANAWQSLFGALAGIVLSAVGLAMTRLFRAMDRRNEELVDCDEQLLRVAERRLAEITGIREFEIIAASDVGPTAWKQMSLALGEHGPPPPPPRNAKPAAARYSALVPGMLSAFFVLFGIILVASILLLIRYRLDWPRKPTSSSADASADAAVSRSDARVDGPALRKAEGAEIAQPICRLHEYHTAIAPARDRFGSWKTVIPQANGAAEGPILGMQTVNAVVLPSGKVLLASGSSWRNLGPIESYPKFPVPKLGTGLFARGSDPFNNDKLASYFQLVNNVAIFDPEKNTFFRIPHPVPISDGKDHFVPNDFFCVGQMHLPDGNVLFAGGTQYYSPYRTGARSTWIFDWRNELTIDWAKVDWRQIPRAGVNSGSSQQPDDYPWLFSGLMRRGRWYPSIVPLLDGRMMVVGGFVGFDSDYPDMYQFEINHLVEFFDPSAFSPTRPNDAWTAIDVSTAKNGPFAVKINDSFKPTEGYRCDRRCVDDNGYDAFKLYPQIYQMPDGRLYFTHEGDWTSLRTCDSAFVRQTRHTYWATLAGTRKAPSLWFDLGPDRPDPVSSYGTSILDPNNDRIEIFGGQPTSPGTLYPLNASDPSHFAGSRGSRKMEIFTPGNRSTLGGRWSIDREFLGDRATDDRTMHYALVLPTRQLLIINGGNYDFADAVTYPLLLTPVFKSGHFVEYRRERMAEALEPRLYHNTAVLLPDATILVSGGNTARATVYPSVLPPPANTANGQPKAYQKVDLDNYFYDDGPIGRGSPGMLTLPTEEWTAEIYSPPYIFIDGDRRAAIAGLATRGASADTTFMKVIGTKRYYLFRGGEAVTATVSGIPDKCSQDDKFVLIKLPSATHGWDGGQKLVELPIVPRKGSNRGAIEVHVPDPGTANAPPGYYMLFYVDCKGKPSVAQMVRYDSKALTP